MNPMYFIEIDEPRTFYHMLAETGLPDIQIEDWKQKTFSFLSKATALDNNSATFLKQKMVSLGGNGTVCKDHDNQFNVILLGNLYQYHQLVRQISEQSKGLEKIVGMLQEHLIRLSNPVSFELDCGCRILHLSERTHIMGILNATPDSFYDGGRYFSHDRAVQRIYEMVSEGADLIDIGGESTRPGSDPVSIDEEIQRVIPIIEQVKGKIPVPISIDTRKSEVAEAAIESGAHMVNDVSGLRFDLKMASVAANHHVPVVVMHMKGLPKDMQQNPEYTDLVGEIYNSLEQSIRIALENGIPKEKIIIDPGIGFGKKWDANFIILKRIKEFNSLGCPILVGVSRKSFIGKALDLKENERLMGTAATVAVSSLKGVHLVRVHDVKEMVQIVHIVDYIRSMSEL